MIIVLGVWWCAWFTRREIPFLPKAEVDLPRLNLKTVVMEMYQCMQNHSYLMLLIAFFFLSLNIGIYEMLNSFMLTFYWEFMPEQIRALGGGSRSGLWNQIKADVTGIRVVALSISAVASVGAMAIAAAAVGMAPNPSTAVERISKVQNEFVADPAETKKYREIFRLYTDLYANNEKLFDRLEKLKQYD